MLPYELFDTPLHRQWKRDRALRQRIPLDECWRGCVGLAALIDDLDDLQWHGDHALYRNEQVTWLALRDVPPGHFPGCGSMNRREVNYASTTVAKLRHGMPVIDFTLPCGRSVDFRRFPFSSFVKEAGGRKEWVHAWGDVLDSDARRREFAVLNKLSVQMTRFAFHGVDKEGHPVRPSWHRRRRRRGEKPYRVPHLMKWMPRPYLGFTHEHAERLYDLSTMVAKPQWVLECPCCGRRSELRLFRAQARQTFESGHFVACCPRCQRRRKWHLSDAVPAKAQRQFTLAFRDRFIKDLAQGLPLRAVGPVTYCGPVRHVHDGEERPHEARKLDLRPHMFSPGLSGKMSLLFLPAEAMVLVKPGERVDAGEVMAHALPSPPPRIWLTMDRVGRWEAMHEVWGVERTSFLQQLWFRHQAQCIPSHPDLLLFPGDLVATAARDVPVQQLWWDFARAGDMDLIDVGEAAVVFPPLRVCGWDRLAFSLPGDVALDVGISDPRYRRRHSVGRSRARRSAGDQRVVVAE